MTSYDTKAKTIGDITVTVSRAKEGNAADRLEAFLKWLADKLQKPVDPDEGRPDNTLPGGGPSGGTKPVDPDEGRPDNTLPGAGGRPDNTLPGAGGRPDNTLPGGGGRPDNSLPGVIGENAKEIAKIILKNTLCDPDKPQPKG